MKKNLHLLILFFALFTFLDTYAGGIIVKGHVWFTNGSPVIKEEVKITAYMASSTASCSELVAITDANGFYSVELSCTGEIRRTRMSIKNCDGQPLVLEKEVPASKIIEANFTVCKPTENVTCTANFTAEPIPASTTVSPFSYVFNSATSEVSTGDQIIHRTWDFHDGSALVNDRIDLKHTFPHAGTYEVCLTIKTVKGCESKSCKAIVVPSLTAVTCTAKFDFEKLSINKFRFHGNLIMLADNDYITERKWDFHDGTTSTEVSPLHEFVKPGNYEVCLIIKTARGCQSRLCMVVKVEEMPMTDNDYIKIISFYPSPVRENLQVVVYSKLNNISANISILNQVGLIQLSKQVALLQGYNSFTIPVFSLMPGSYFFKLKTQFGTLSKPFYKF